MAGNLPSLIHTREFEGQDLSSRSNFLQMPRYGPFRHIDLCYRSKGGHKMMRVFLSPGSIF